MPSPFPGMDPYLERPSLSPGLHVKAISEIQDVLNPKVRPNYLVQIESRVIDPEIEEAFLEIHDRPTNTLVTVIEVLSPSNKSRGSAGRDSFMTKRRQLLASNVNWVEIDLLRGGLPTLKRVIPSSDYRVIVSRVGERHVTSCWPIGLRQNLPMIGIPLKENDPDVALDLGALLDAIYDRAGYEDLIDYAKPPEPPLKADDAKWANKLLRAKGLR